MYISGGWVMRIEVDGDKELVQKLESLKKTHAKSAIRKGSRAGCKLVAARVKQSVPTRTGTLKGQIKVRSWPRSRRWTGTQVTTTVAGGPAYYGAFVELGHKTRRGKKIEGKFFIRQAFKDTQESTLAIFLDTMAAEIERRT
jgi:HK97 gp10 family phage protein